MFQTIALYKTSSICKLEGVKAKNLTFMANHCTILVCVIIRNSMTKKPLLNNRLNDYCRNLTTIRELVEPKSSKCNTMDPI